MKIPFLNDVGNLLEPKKYPDHAVGSVDLKRFQGKWYEIAALPTWFEKGCTCSTAEYSLVDGYLAVRNTCTRNGRHTAKRARAYPVPDSGDARLKVQYYWPLKRDYWIITRDEDYRYAMVGHPAKKYLWILSREPQMDDAVYRSLVAMARSRGYDVERLQKTNQYCFA